jgi:hypothetical protein
MILQPQETARFYTIWFAMLSYANRRLKLVAELPESPQDGSINAQDAYKMRCATPSPTRTRPAYRRKTWRCCAAGIGASPVIFISSAT